MQLQDFNVLSYNVVRLKWVIHFISISRIYEINTEQIIEIMDTLIMKFLIKIKNDISY